MEKAAVAAVPLLDREGAAAAAAAAAAITLAAAVAPRSNVRGTATILWAAETRGNNEWSNSRRDLGAEARAQQRSSVTQ